MAKLEQQIYGNFDDILDRIDRAVLDSGVSADFEDGSDWSSGGVRCAVRVYERYSAIGGNRVSMNVTLVGEGNHLFLTAITSGGSQAVLFKINTLGEGAFLDVVEELLDRWNG